MPSKNRVGIALLLLSMMAIRVEFAFGDVFNMPAGQTSLQFAPVGDAGNPNDPLTGFGSVPYNYRIGKFEVTVGQYTQFLNAVAASDTYVLYNPSMASNANIAGIARSGGSGSYTYSTIGSPNHPICYVSWGDAARFVNWLTNGQPTGAQGPATTETGSYALNGATSDAALNAVTRSASARYVIPTENEWYKAAYYDPTNGGSNYWLYPMRTDAAPFSDQPPGSDAPNPAFTANFYKNDSIANGYDDGFAVTGAITQVNSQNYLTDVGAYASAASYYSAFDQGGNIDEWNETLISGQFRGVGGGSWGSPDIGLRSTSVSTTISYPPSGEYPTFGFRIAEVPEPATATLLAAGSLLLLRKRKLSA